jgi:hypothetical protein
MMLDYSTACCIYLILFALLVFFFVRSRRRKATEVKSSAPLEKNPQEYLLSGKRNLQKGNRQDAVKDFVYVYRHGRPNLRQQAVEALEEMGEVEIF